MQSKKILVTGGAGYIGSNTVGKLIQAGFQVVVVDNLSTGFEKNLHPEAIFYREDILNTPQITDIILREHIFAIVHFAAKIVVPESLSHPHLYYKNNTQGVLSILEAIKMTGGLVKHFIFSSTAAVYGNPERGGDCISEEFPTLPINPYGMSKLMSEKLITDCEKELSMTSVILRYFNVAGADTDLKFGQRSNKATHLIKLASETALKKRDQLEITGTDYPTKDGTGVRDYIHVEDLATVHVLALEYLMRGHASEIFNCGYGKGFSVKEVIETMQAVTKESFKVTHAARRPGDAAMLVADSSKLKKALNWMPAHDSLEEICRSAYLFEKHEV